jgi:transposase
MQYIQKESRGQITFLPDCIEDYISEDNPVRVIDALVDSLDLPVLGFTHASLCETGSKMVWWRPLCIMQGN